MHRRFAAFAAVVLTGVVLAGCGSEDTGGTVADPPDSADLVTRKVDVKAENTAFDPTAIQLKAGEAAEFVLTNADDIDHTLTIADLDVDIEAGGKATESASTGVLEAGTYAFECTIHPNMKGTITVA